MARVGILDVTHGDLWLNNILFASDANGRATDEIVAVVDWQVKIVLEKTIVTLRRTCKEIILCSISLAS